MSDAAIVIEVTDKGSAKVKRNLDEITMSAERTERSAFNLKNAFIALTTSQIVRGLVNISDTFTAIKTGIENVTSSTAEYNSTFNKLFAIAQKNGAAFGGLTKGFVQLNVSLEDSVKNSTDLVKVTDLISRGLAAAGANGNTSAGVLLQLSQGLATDFKAAGQELNSLIEGAPILAKAIAEQLGGKGATDLKKFAEEGKLTAKAFLDALIAAEDSINAFAIPPTIERSFIRLQNAFGNFITQSPIFTGIMTGLASTLDYVANNFDVLTEAVGALAVAITITLVGRAIPLLISGFTTVIATIQSMTLATVGFNTVALGATGIIGVFAAVGAAAYIFRDELSATVLFIINEITDAVDGAITKVSNLGTQLSTTASVLGAFAKNQAGLLSDEDYEKRLLSLDSEQNKLIKNGNDALKERIELRDAELQRTLEGYGKKGSVNDDFIKPNSDFLSTGGGDTKAIKELRKELNSLINSTKSDYQLLLEDIEKVNEATRSGLISESEAVKLITDLKVKYADSIKTGNNANKDLTDSLKELINQNDRFKNSVADTFAQFATGAVTAKQALRSLIQDFISAQAKMAFGGAGIGGLFSAAGSSLLGGGDIFGSQGIFNRLETGGSFDFQGPLPKFANGGSMTIGGNPGVDKNLLSLNGSPIAKVGRGETLSVNPNSSGQQPIVVNQTINLSTGVQQTVRAEVMRMLPQIQQVTTSGVEDARMRGAFA